MQNLATPTDLVQEELSARIETLHKDRARVENELRAARTNLQKAEDSVEDNANRLAQFIAARLALEPEESFTTKSTYRVLLDDVAEMPRGTVARVLRQYERGFGRGYDWFVTTDDSLPILPDDYNLTRAIFTPGQSVWVDESNSRSIDA